MPTDVSYVAEEAAWRAGGGGARRGRRRGDRRTDALRRYPTTNSRSELLHALTRHRIASSMKRPPSLIARTTEPIPEAEASPRLTRSRSPISRALRLVKTSLRVEQAARKIAAKLQSVSGETLPGSDRTNDGDRGLAPHCPRAAGRRFPA